MLSPRFPKKWLYQEAKGRLVWGAGEWPVYEPKVLGAPE